MSSSTTEDTSSGDSSKNASREIIKILVSYIPKLVVNQFQTFPKPIIPPHIEHYAAAVLFADISGFTRLTEQIAQLGPKGIEQISRHLNTYFDKLIALINKYGGDIIKFAGDALIAVWVTKATAENLPSLVLLACQCALGMQKKLHDFRVESTDTTHFLQLHVGIGAGKIAGLYAGGEKNIIEFFITGEPLEQVTECEKNARPGEVYLSKTALLYVKDDVIVAKPPPTDLNTDRSGASPLASIMRKKKKKKILQLSGEVIPTLNTPVKLLALYHWRASRTGE